MRDKLQRAVLALAQPADVQLSLFPDFLDFEDGLYELVGHEHEITAEQRAAVEELDRIITGMSGKQNASFWTEDALRSHPTWEQIRSAAKAVVGAFRWELRRPPPSDAVYIPAGR